MSTVMLASLSNSDQSPAMAILHLARERRPDMFRDMMLRHQAFESISVHGVT
jgi:hypothetical protein